MFFIFYWYFWHSFLHTKHLSLLINYILNFWQFHVLPITSWLRWTFWPARLYSHGLWVPVHWGTRPSLWVASQEPASPATLIRQTATWTICYVETSTMSQSRPWEAFAIAPLPWLDTFRQVIFIPFLLHCKLFCCTFSFINGRNLFFLLVFSL